jgi:hypothetical protein
MYIYIYIYNVGRMQAYNIQQDLERKKEGSNKTLICDGFNEIVEKGEIGNTVLDGLENNKKIGGMNVIKEEGEIEEIMTEKMKKKEKKDLKKDKKDKKEKKEKNKIYSVEENEID